MSETEMMKEWEDELALEGKTRDGFMVTDDGGAAWCVRKIREAVEERDRMIDWYERQIEKAKQKCTMIEARMYAYLMDYAENVPMKESKTQRSYQVPGGKLVWKKEHTEYRHDDAVILEALKKGGRTEYVKTVEKLDWAGLKKEITATGEIIDGVTVETVPEAFGVQVD